MTHTSIVAAGSGDPEADLLPVHAHPPTRWLGGPPRSRRARPGRAAGGWWPQRGHWRGAGRQEPLGRGGHVRCLVRLAGGCTRRPTRPARPARRPGRRRPGRCGTRCGSPCGTAPPSRSWWRPGLGEQVLDPVLPADPVEEHLDRRPVEPAGEHLPVVGQDLPGHPVGPQRQRQALAHPAARSPGASGARDAEPGVVIDPGQRLRAGPSPARTRRPRPSATAPSAPRAPTASTSGPAAADPRDRSGSTAPTPGRPPTPTAPARHPAWPAHDQPPRPQRGMRRRSTRSQPRPRPDLMRTRPRPMRPVPRLSNPPASYRPARNAPSAANPEPGRHARDRLAVADHRQHGLIPLLSHAQLPHQGVSRISRSRCQASAEDLSPINRSPNVTYQPKQHTVRCPRRESNSRPFA